MNLTKTMQPVCSASSIKMLPKDLAEQSRNLIKEIDLAYKLATRVIELAEANDAKDSELWDNTLLNGRGRSNLKKTADDARKLAVEQLKQVRYFTNKPTGC